jgi:hypothetical protein
LKVGLPLEYASIGRFSIRACDSRLLKSWNCLNRSSGMSLLPSLNWLYVIAILALGVLPLQPTILQSKNASPAQGLTAGTAENEKMARAGGLPESAASDPLAQLRACSVMEREARLECLETLSLKMAPPARPTPGAGN